MRERRWIVDTTLRDGEQRPGIALRPEDKIQLALLLDDINVHEIEVGIPNVDTEGIDYVKEIMKKKKNSYISVWSRVNEEDVIYSVSCCPDIIHIGTPVSYVQIYSKLKKNKVWMQKTLARCVDIAMNHGVKVTVGFEDSSRADVGFMIHTARLLKDMGVETIRIADTVGVLTPCRTRTMIEEILEHVDINIEMHAHNDLGMAIANSIEGAKAGAKLIDCALFGIGERSGNCNMWEFLHAAERTFDFGIQKKKVREVEKAFEKIAGGNWNEWENSSSF
ncbi:beta/alpha barrel domain-containing protein [Anaeromicropila populeti]|uniref:Homocitrate synthase NifV n=1 Tax=Anaeromicropila populeti TaxID=37658 RepID=A0A1I6HV06_9FIRM|nr:homocitrate synthase [Anaeromicropila populeti]SFR58248.1 homocitrate synthase NifV [Anaeromicropila populeti]